MPETKQQRIFGTKCPDAEVMFELTSRAWDGSIRTIFSGYRPQYEVKPDYQTSVLHRFVDAESVSTGGRAKAEVWFLTPEVYPHSLYEEQKLKVAEGQRVVGIATVLKVLNPLLLRPSDDRSQSN